MAATRHECAAARGRRAGRREGDRDRRPGPARLRPGRRLAARRRARGRVLRLTEVMRQRDPAERRALAALHERRPHALPGMGRQRRTHRDVQPAGRRARPGGRGVGRMPRPRSGWAGGDDRPRQRHPPRAQPRRTRAAPRPGLLGEQRVYGRSAARGRRPRDLPPQRPRARRRQRDARHRPPPRRRSRRDRNRRRLVRELPALTSPSTSSTPTRSPATACRAPPSRPRSSSPARTT